MIYAGGQDDLIDTSDEEEYKEGGSEEKHVMKTEQSPARPENTNS